MNRLLTPEEDVRSDGGQSRDGTGYRVSPLNRLFSSVSSPRALAPILLLAQGGKGSPNTDLCVGGPEPGLRGLGRVPKSGPEVPQRCGRSTKEADEPQFVRPGSRPGNSLGRVASSRPKALAMVWRGEAILALLFPVEGLWPSK